MIMKSALVMTIAAILSTPATAASAHPAAPGDRAEVLAAWTQTTETSFTRWNAARLQPADWAEYRFDWSTDLCTAAPDRPLGFDFRLACRRHDFGYRNYSETSRFKEARPRLDRAFYADLSRICDRHPSSARPACKTLAWTYYQTVRRRPV